MEYLSTFTTGFARVIRERLPQDLPGASVTAAFDGMLRFRYDGPPRSLERLPYLNNTYALLLPFHGSNLRFDRMAEQAARAPRLPYQPSRSFRVRFSRENRFESVDSRVAALAEDQVRRQTGMRVDRVSPATEMWYIIRSENVGFYCQLLFRRKATEKNLRQGELRPEFAHLMALCASIKPGDVVYDPFCGYGAIPRQVLRGFRPGKALLSDIDPQKIRVLREEVLFQEERARVFQSDALVPGEALKEIADVVITDPPWGYYEAIDDLPAFYGAMLDGLMYVLKKDGRAVILSARKQEMEDALQNRGLMPLERIDTLVNGKKARLFILKKPGSSPERNHG